VSYTDPKEETYKLNGEEVPLAMLIVTAEHATYMSDAQDLLLRNVQRMLEGSSADPLCVKDAINMISKFRSRFSVNITPADPKIAELQEYMQRQKELVIKATSYATTPSPETVSMLAVYLNARFEEMPVNAPNNWCYGQVDVYAGLGPAALALDKAWHAEEENITGVLVYDLPAYFPEFDSRSPLDWVEEVRETAADIVQNYIEHSNRSWCSDGI
jgi:hypothetical protein